MMIYIDGYKDRGLPFPAIKRLRYVKYFIFEKDKFDEIDDPSTRLEFSLLQ
jgi:hypothetical protein